MKLGYARVSTEDQNLDIQRGRLSQAGCEMMFEEKISGTARGRPELERLMAHLRKDDVLTRMLPWRTDRARAMHATAHRSGPEVEAIVEPLGRK